MMKKYLITILLILFSISLVTAQTSKSSDLITDSGSRIKVEIQTDDNGKVISAKALNGSPEKKSFAEKAAMDINTERILKDGKPIKGSRVIELSFSASKLGSWFNLGMSIAAVEKLPTLRFFEPTFLSTQIPSDWETENKMIGRLEELKQIELKTDNGEIPVERVIDNTTSKETEKLVVKTETRRVTISPDQKISPEANAIAQSLIASIRGRLGTEPINQLYFNLGIELNRALEKADSYNKDERLQAAKIFQDFVQNSKFGVSKEVLSTLEALTTSIEKGVFTDEDTIKLSKYIMTINTLNSNR